MSPLENRVPPPLLFMMTAIAMWLASRHESPAFPTGYWSVAIIVLCLVIGLAMGGPAIRAFREAATTVDPVNISQASQLVTTGVFRFSRNPMYVSLSALLIAWAVQLDTA